jgi:hypothetical protein
VTNVMDTTWSADHLRVSFFASDVWPVSAESIFFDAFASEPETITSKPSALESSAVGVWDGLRLEVKRTFTRVDFVLQAIPTEEAGPMPMIQDVKAILPKFSSLVAKWASIQPQGVVRIALGYNAFLLSKNVDDSYVKLRNLIKVIDIDVARFKEFRFQVNLPQPSTIAPDIVVNRLSNWASVAIRAALIGVDAPRYFDDKHYVSCSLDVNTDGERIEPINNYLVESLTEELSLICSNILDVGIS